MALYQQQKRGPQVLFFCGTSWNRTNDTRIFSPLLYQLSYGTKAGANIMLFIHSQNLKTFYCQYADIIYLFLIPFPLIKLPL